MKDGVPPLYASSGCSTARSTAASARPTALAAGSFDAGTWSAGHLPLEERARPSVLVLDDVHELTAPGGRTLLDRVLTPLNRLGSKRFLREARQKVWHNTLELRDSRVAGADAYAVRLAELELLSAAKIADLLLPGQVLLRLAVAGFGVSLPPPDTRVGG